jgi:hypothetical protein
VMARIKAPGITKPQKALARALDWKEFVICPAGLVGKFPLQGGE